MKIQERKTLHVKIPLELFDELRTRHLFADIDDVVSKLLIEHYNFDGAQDENL